jgi:aspartyl-tRNA(Asn)/glutamyl-tRNA(Gln) amidotransferase subunit A
VAGLRIALSPDLGCYHVDADVAANTMAAADRLRDAGASVHEVSLPWDLETIGRAVNIHFGMIFGASMKELCDQHADELTSYVRRLVADSELVSKDDFIAGLELEAEIYAPLGQLLDDYDALICPTFAVPALPAEYDTDEVVEVNGRRGERWFDVMMTLPFNIASRCPVLSVPSGLSRDGVPTGLAVVGKTYDDVTAFRVAAAHAERLPWLTGSGPRPGL